MTDIQRGHGLPQPVVDSLTAIFTRWPGIERVWLYGSRAKGTHRKGSDIDLCIEGPDLSLTDILSIEGAIDELMLPYSVDLSLKHQIENPALLEHIDRVGTVLYKRASVPSPARLTAPTGPSGTSM